MAEVNALGQQKAPRFHHSAFCCRWFAVLCLLDASIRQRRITASKT